MIKRPCFLFLCVLYLNGCQWQNDTKPSVLVIAVDTLPSDLITCLDETELLNSGFATLCAESVRFTHAYTTSLLSVAALSSVLTAQYPYETRLTNNGSNYLANEVKTVSEYAVEKGYRTSFYSGGPPVFRRSGLAQGFEVFDDNIPVNLSESYRPLSQSLDLLEQWIEKDVKSKPFFSFIFASDLQYPNLPTKNDMGEQRATSIKGQAQEIDESLFDFFAKLKKLNRWDSTYVILVGLSGFSPAERASELPGTNLYSENTQVSLLIKPPTKKRDYGVRWKVDENVSLIDVGTTLFDILNVSPPKGEQRPSPSVSLGSVITESPAALGRDRALLIESGWGAWRGISNTRYAFQIEQYLVLFDQEIKTFNTLVDRQQLVPIGQNESALLKILDKPKEFIKLLGFTPWSGIDPLIYRKYRLARQLWIDKPNEVEEEELKILVDIQKTKNEVVSWAAFTAAEKKDWKELLRLSKKFKDPNWEYIAKRSQSLKADVAVSSCLRMVLGLESYNAKNKPCEDSYSQDFKAWLDDKGKKTSAIKERFVKAYRRSLIDRKLLAMNYHNGYLWDTIEKSVFELNPVDLFLSLPENQKLKAQLTSEI